MAKLERFAFRKLAAGNLPAKLEREGCRVFYRTPTLEEMRTELPRKLQEEAAEVLAAVAKADREELRNELGDVVEVLLAMDNYPQFWDSKWLKGILDNLIAFAAEHGITPEAIEEARQAKRALKGGLDTAIYLVHADVPVDDPAQQAWLEQFRADPAKYPSLGLVD
jgi:predicted house-cleaning noncanonical NTP pyrophosphatase (MazG superfamily)